ncbi:hypothetical protein QVD17_06317 [Tagetes erecta]|uniref:DUF8039 domain-containing protein n=1 Tax=Tagetes erecta TaxID=13708 RepID=A0AAD8LDS2_TARER|nr:hypothetical protein QVD17_06317 [Tagetes erecta]
MSNNIPIEKRKLLKFTKDGQPCGLLAAKFKTWYSNELKHNFSYHIPMSNFPKEDFDRMWLQAKAYWMIQTDAPREFMKKWSKKRGTNWRCELNTKFVKKNKNACDTYPFLDRDHWNDFVAQKSTDEFKAKSVQAKTANAANKNVLRLGRSGWVGFKERKENIWPQLVAKYTDFKGITNSRSRWFLMGHAKENKETNEYELTEFVIEIGVDLYRVEQEMIADGSYAQNKDDPLVRVVGPEHGGRSRTVSNLVGHTKVDGGLYKNMNHHTDCDARLDTMRHASSYGSDGCVEYPPIETHTPCELLMNVGDNMVTVAYGDVWPHQFSDLHSRPISQGCVKVSVDAINDVYYNLGVYKVTKTDEVKCVEDMTLQIVQWPRYAIKLSSKIESSHGSQRHGVDSPPLHDDENTFTSGYMPDVNVVNVKLEETDMNVVNAELEETIGGNIHDLLYEDDIFDENVGGTYTNLIRSVVQRFPVVQTQPAPETEGALEAEPAPKYTATEFIENCPYRIYRCSTGSILGYQLFIPTNYNP